MSTNDNSINARFCWQTRIRSRRDFHTFCYTDGLFKKESMLVNFVFPWKKNFRDFRFSFPRESSFPQRIPGSGHYNWNRQVIKYKCMYWVWCLKSTGYEARKYWVYTGYEAWKYWVILLFELLDTLRCFWSWCFCQVVVLVGCFFRSMAWRRQRVGSPLNREKKPAQLRCASSPIDSKICNRFRANLQSGQWRYQNGRNGYRAKPSLLRSIENAEFFRRDWRFDFRSF